MVSEALQLRKMHQVSKRKIPSKELENVAGNEKFAANTVLVARVAVEADVVAAIQSSSVVVAESAA